MLTQNSAIKRQLKMWSPPLIVIFLCGIAQFMDCVLLLRYQRELIEAGQLWRLLSGHFVHLGWSHWLMNCVALAVIWVILQPLLRSVWIILNLLLCSLMVGLGLYFFSPDVVWYVGLSGALHGLLIFALLALLKQQPGFALLVLAGVVAKLLWEQFVGPLPGSEATAGGAVVVVAHAYGAIAGVILSLLKQAYVYLRHRKSSAGLS